MHMLRDYVNRIDGLKGFVEQATSNSVTQGIVLDINPVWLLAYRLDRAGLRPFPYDMRWSIPSLLGEGLVHLETFEGDDFDFKWKDKQGWVQGVTRHLLGRSENEIPDSALPFIVKVIARPVNSEFFAGRAQLVTLAERQSFFAIVETRPLGTLAVSPGDACLANNVPGTIGGFLRDQNTGSVYAATCGHVVSTGTSVNVSGSFLGSCLHSHAPAKLGPGQPCTPACPGANKLDLALIDVGPAIVTNKVTGVAAKIASHQSIVLRGGISNVNSFEVGGLVLTYCPGKSNVCFENLFEVRPPSPSGILSARVRTALATLPQQGDSGGWVETSSNEWCGILVAVDHLMGYALEADDTLSQADALFRTRLQVV